MSTPIPPAAFSAFAMARSIFSSLITAGTRSRTALRAGRPITSPKIRIRMIFDSAFNLRTDSTILKFERRNRDRKDDSRQDGNLASWRECYLVTQVGGTKYNPLFLTFRV